MKKKTERTFVRNLSFISLEDIIIGLDERHFGDCGGDGFVPHFNGKWSARLGEGRWHVSHRNINAERRRGATATNLQQQ